jgi:hypothetical protein
MHQVFQRRNSIFALLLAIGCFGCGGSSDRPKLGQVTGTVNHNGKPVADGEIVFYPEKGRSATGQVKDGKILNVTTFDPNDGAPIGKVKATVIALDGPKNDMYKPGKLVSPAKYISVDTTDLSTEIKPGANTVAFDMKD